MSRKQEQEPFTLRPGNVVRVPAFQKVETYPDGSGGFSVNFKAPRGQIFVLCFLGVEPKDGTEPLDPEQILDAMGWMKKPEMWPDPTEEPKPGEEAFCYG